jgi:hypothetical protein
MSRIVAAIALGLAFAFAAPLAHAQTAEPEQIVRDIYAQYGPDSWPDDPQGQYFSEDLLALYNDVAEGAGESPELGIDFDIFLNAQDIDTVTDLTTRIDQKTDDLQVVDVTFTAFEQQQTIRYTFIPTDAGWKIDDIDWGEEGANLRALLGELADMQQGEGMSDGEGEE